MKLRYFAGLTIDDAAEALGYLQLNRRSALDLRSSLAVPGIELRRTAIAVLTHFRTFLAFWWGQFIAKRRIVLKRHIRMASESEMQAMEESENGRASRYSSKHWKSRLPDRSRRTILDEACGEDTTLRAQVS